MQGNSSSIHLRCSYFLNVIKAKNSSNSLIAMEIYQQWNEQITSIGQRHINLAEGKVIKGNVWRHLNLRSCLTPKQRLNVRLTKGVGTTSGGRRLRSFADVASGEPKKWRRLTIVGHCVLHRKNRKRGNYQLTANIVLFARSFEAVAVFARQSMTLLSGNIQSGNTGFSTVMKAFQCLCHKITCVWLVCTWR